MPRPKKQHAHENHERWLLTYADMITLLVAFFIMLYAMSVMNEHKFQQVAISVRSGFGGQIQGADSILDGTAQSSAAISMTEQVSGELNKEVQDIRPRIKQKDLLIPDQNGPSMMDTTLKKLRDVIKQQHLEKVVQVKAEERGIVVTVLTDKFLFQKGEADIVAANCHVLDAMAGPLKSIPNEVRVEGYTDDLPICTEKYPSNWELSTSRATSVLRYFIDHNEVPPDRLSAAGYADTRPICPNTSEENRAMNRRVEIVVLRQSDVAET